MKKWIQRGRDIALVGLCAAAAACGSDTMDSSDGAPLQASPPATTDSSLDTSTMPAVDPAADTSMAASDTNTAAGSEQGASGAAAPQPSGGAESAEPASGDGAPEASSGTETPEDGQAQDPEQGTPAQTDDAGEATATGDTWDSFAQGFFQTYCVGCHPNLLPLRDYNLYDSIIADAEAIRCGVAPTQLDGCTGNPAPAQFPAGAPYPSDEERLQLVAWIEAGMPQ